MKTAKRLKLRRKRFISNDRGFTLFEIILVVLILSIAIVPMVTAFGPAIFSTGVEEEIAVFTNAASTGYLFLSEMFYPGWKATVDGHPRPIMRGNYLFRVVQVPAGPHVVRFIFDPLSIKVGMGVTVLTVFIVICLTVYGLAGKTHPLERDETPEQPAV